MFLFGPYGEPLRDSEVIRNKIMSTPFNYAIVPENEIDSNPGSHSTRYKMDGIGGVSGKAVVDGLVLVADTVPERFVPIMAAHGRGHNYGLSHQEMFNLEMDVAGKISEITGDKSLKEDYLRWLNNRYSATEKAERLVEVNFGYGKETDIDNLTHCNKLKRDVFFGAYGEPLQDSENVRDKIMSTPFEYAKVPESEIGGPGSYISRYKLGEIGEGLGKKRIAIVDGLVLVADTVPELFVPIVAAHERGHHYGLSHQEMFNLEMDVAKKVSETTKNPRIKEDYLRWINSRYSNRKKFEKIVKANFGKEKQQNIDRMTDYINLKKETDTDNVYTIENDKLVELF